MPNNLTPKHIYLEIYNKAHNNAILLLRSSELLFSKKSYHHAYALAYTALEEISKSQFAADVYTRLQSEYDFKKFYLDHKKKLSSVQWAHHDAKNRPKWHGPDIDDIEVIDPDQPSFEKRKASLYVDVDFLNMKVYTPVNVVTEKDAKDIIHIVEVALQRIFEVSNDEFGTGRIGTKGFMK